MTATVHYRLINYATGVIVTMTEIFAARNEVNVFTPVCHSVHRVVVSATPRDQRQTPPWASTPLPSACWDTHTLCTVHAGIWSISGQYASHWNAFLSDHKFIILHVKPFFWFVGF